MESSSNEHLLQFFANYSLRSKLYIDWSTRYRKKTFAQIGNKSGTDVPVSIFAQANDISIKFPVLSSARNGTQKTPAALIHSLASSVSEPNEDGKPRD